MTVYADVLAHTDLLAKSGEAAKSGPLGFAIILVLCVVCYFLFKSMSKHLKRVREDFPGDQQPSAPEAGEVRETRPAPTPQNSADEQQRPPG